MRPIVFFDVDNTLVDGYTGYETTLFLIKVGIIKKRRLAQALFYKLASTFHLSDVLKMYRIANMDMAGQHIDTMRAHGRFIFDKWFAHRVFSEGVATLRRHQAAGDEVVLLSSAPYMTVDVLAERLGVECCYAMGPRLDDTGILLNEVREPVTVDHRKLDVARAHAEAQGVSLSHCTFYTDSIRDVALLREVGRPIVINPDRKLRREAKKRGWQVHTWRAHHAPLRPELLRGPGG